MSTNTFTEYYFTKKNEKVETITFDDLSWVNIILFFAMAIKKLVTVCVVSFHEFSEESSVFIAIVLSSLIKIEDKITLIIL